MLLELTYKGCRIEPIRYMKNPRNLTQKDEDLDDLKQESKTMVDRISSIVERL